MKLGDAIRNARDAHEAWNIYKDIRGSNGRDSFPFNKIIEKIGACRSVSNRDAVGMLNDIWNHCVKQKIANKFTLAMIIKAMKFKRVFIEDMKQC